MATSVEGDPGPAPFVDSFIKLNGTFISRTVAAKNPIDREDREGLAVLAALEQKREQLENQIAEFVQAKQEEYRVFEKEILKGSHLADTTARLPLGPNNPVIQDQPGGLKDTSSKHDSGVDWRESEQSPKSPAVTDPLGSGSATPVRDRDFSLADLVLPNFLPLLDCKPIERPSSAMSVPAIPTIATMDSGLQTPTSRNRQQSAPPAFASSLPNPKSTLNSKPARRKSSLRTSSVDGSVRRPSRKSVSLLVDDCVVRPADSNGVETPVNESAIVSPTSDTPSSPGLKPKSPSPKPVPGSVGIKPPKPRDLSKASKKLRSPPPSSPPQSPYGFFSPTKLASPKLKAPSSPPTPTALQSPVEDTNPNGMDDQKPLPDVPSPTATSAAIDLPTRSLKSSNSGSPSHGTATPTNGSQRILSNSYHKPDVTAEALAIISQQPEEMPSASYVGSLEGEARGASWMEANALARAAAREGEMRESERRRVRLEEFEREVPRPERRGRGFGRVEDEEVLGVMEGI